MVRTGTVFVDAAGLFYRQIGSGPPILVVHGGPGVLDHTYLLPDMDRLAGDHRLIYYDQRCHGASTGDVDSAREVGVESYVRDLDAVLEHVGLDRVALLGHSWGGHLAMRYAIRHPQRLSHLILMNTSPASKGDFDAYVRHRRALTAAVADELNALRGTPTFESGDPSAVAEAARLSFSIGIKRPEDVARLILSFTTENIVRGRAVSERFDQLLFSQEFDLTPQLAALQLPTLVLHGDHDFIPVEAAATIAGTIPGARLVVVPECGHFAYLEAPDAVHSAVTAFLRT